MLRWARFNEKMEAVEQEQQRLRSTWVHKDHPAVEQINPLLKTPISKEASLEELLRRPEVTYNQLMAIESIGPAFD